MNVQDCRQTIGYYLQNDELWRFAVKDRTLRAAESIQHRRLRQKIDTLVRNLESTSYQLLYRLQILTAILSGDERPRNIFSFSISSLFTAISLSKSTLDNIVVV